MWNSIGGTASPSINWPSKSISTMSSTVSALRTEAPELMSIRSPATRALKWPLKSTMPARSSIDSASTSICFFETIELSFMFLVLLQHDAIGLVSRW